MLEISELCCHSHPALKCLASKLRLGEDMLKSRLNETGRKFVRYRG